jgi:hypothetical protein
MLFVGNGRLGPFDGGEKFDCLAPVGESRGASWSTYVMEGEFIVDGWAPAPPQTNEAAAEAGAGAGAALKFAAPPPTADTWTGPTARVVRTAGGFPALTLGAGPPVPTFWLNIVNNIAFGGEAAVAEEIIRAKQAGVNVLSICLSTAWVDGMPDWLNFSAVDGAAGTRSTFDLIAKHHPTAALIVRWDITSFEQEWWMQVCV